VDDYFTNDHYEAIMDLPIATNDRGDILYHSLEWAKRENIVIVWSDNKGWMRGKNNLRYRVMPTGHDSPHPFPQLKSGRK